MNQILSTSMPMEKKNKYSYGRKDKNYKKIPTEIIIKFFAMIMIVFGISMIGKGSYTIYKNQLQIKENNLVPTISLESKTENITLLKVVHKRIIDKVEYRWNAELPIVISGNNGQYVEQEIKIPTGKNTLHILVQDKNGKEITYDKEYDIPSNIDIMVSGNKIKISYESDILVSYMTYRWDDGEENTITIDGTSIEKEIDVMKGLHELTVIVVDENNNTDTRIQKINGVSKPNVKVDFDDTITHFVIIASDDEQLSKIEFKLNQDESQQYVLNLEEMNLKELTYTLPMEIQEGENILEVTVYNSNGLNEYTGVRFYRR